MLTEPQPATAFVTESLRPFEVTEGFKPGVQLFQEGEEPRGIYFVHSGDVELVYSSRTGSAKPLRRVEPGSFLGLSCVVSNRKHDCSATVRSEARIGMVPREEFQRLLDERPDLWMTVLQIISGDINSCWQCMRSLNSKC
ncbi:MAG TPA: cyclic nucleotide-binding domain-containing protein [Thermoanaerobaculia bacterium]|nr:cyclic nucleotide-binding domain-containing protein [Thermoanaerobaculia bacterium]